MPTGEEMFTFHGYSGPCPKPPLPKYEDVSCPFCKEDGYDLGGLKTHLEHGDCDKFNETENYTDRLKP